MKRILGALIMLVTVYVFGIAHFDATNKNLSPTGVATNCWSFVGEAQCFSYVGLPAGWMCNAVTAVGRRAFATASHIGYTPNFVSYQGNSYAVVGEVYLSGPEGDAKLILVGTDLASWAPTFTNSALAAHLSAGALTNASQDFVLCGNGAQGSFYPGTPGQTGVTPSGVNTKRWSSGFGLRATNAIVCSGTIDATNMTKVQCFFDNVTGQGGTATSGDSGTSCFIFNSLHNRYEFLMSMSCADNPALYNTFSSTGFPIYQHISTFGPYMDLDGSGSAPPAVVPSTKDRPSLSSGKRRRGL